MMLLAKRANLSGIISDMAYESFCITASKLGWRKEEPSRIEPERSELFEQLVYRAVCEEDWATNRAGQDSYRHR